MTTEFIELFMQKYGPWFFLAYILLKDGWPVILRVFEKIIPAKIRENEKKLDAKIELENAEMDLREREIVTQEMIGKNLVIMNERLAFSEMNSRIIIESLEKTNQGMAILLDRRKEDRSRN